MFRLILIIAITLISVLISHESWAGVTYSPGPRVSLTGTTSDVRFDGASVLYGTPFSGGYLDTATRNMSGAFYMNGIGWALFSSGAYQVSLDCGGQSLDHTLMNPCQFTGSGWSENIGEVGFQGVQYLPSSGALTGSIRSFAGNFSVVGIYMPLHPAVLQQNVFLDIPASDAVNLSIREPHRYTGNPWNLHVSNIAGLPSPFLVSGGMDSVGVFNPVDLQKTGNYTLRITDPNGGITEYDGVTVVHGLPVTMNLTKSAGPVPADGVSPYNFTLSFTDQYANPVDTGDITISYTGTVSEVQLPSEIVISPYPIEQKNTLIFGGDYITVWDMSDNWVASPIALSPAPVTYSLASIAPTDGADNRIVLDKIVYTSSLGTREFTDTTLVEFEKPYTVNLSPFTPIVGASNIFGVAIAKQTSELLPYKNINLLEIGNGILAQYDGLSTTETHTGMSPDANWIINSTPSSITVATSPLSYTFSGVYTPNTAYPVIEGVDVYSIIQYTVGATDVAYLADSETSAATYNASRVKILGQNNARSEYGTIGTNSSTRTSFMGTIRKNISLMGRGRTTFGDVRYHIYTTDTSVNNTSFDDNDAIIAIGGDITITSNIAKRDTPLAIIALADENGNGGNIIIDDIVTDINAGIFADRAVRSTGDNQLYIYGALISGNTLGETAAGICPYYVEGVCNAEEYDLENLRGYDASVGQQGSSRASEFGSSALIIEYDMRLQTEPPPGIPE